MSSGYYTSWIIDFEEYTFSTTYAKATMHISATPTLSRPRESKTKIAVHQNLYEFHETFDDTTLPKHGREAEDAPSCNANSL